MKMNKIPFNRSDIQGNELEYLKQAIDNGHISGDGIYTKKCSSLLELELGVEKVLLTTSCTHALEMAAILSNHSKCQNMLQGLCPCKSIRKRSVV